jgi:hypothetical protein
MFRHASMECWHPGSPDASESVHANLGSGDPCRNDELAAVSFSSFISFTPSAIFYEKLEIILPNAL